MSAQAVAESAVSGLPAPAGGPLLVADLATRELALDTSLSSVQSQMSEMYSKVYEVQELRHSPSAATASAVDQSPLDAALVSLDTLLTSIASTMPGLQAEVAALVAQQPDGASLLDRLDGLEAQWTDLVGNVEEVKEELREDRWLGQFRTAADQASDMMASLEKAMVHIQDLVNQVRLLQQPPHGGIEAWRDPASVPDVPLSSFEKSLKSYEARAESYRPSVDKVLSILDKGARERVTRNGEALRKHADLLSRWQNLTERMARLEIDTTSAHLWLLSKNSPVAQQRLPHAPRSVPNELSAYGAGTPSSSALTDDVSSSEGSRQTSMSSRLKTPPLDSAKSRRSSVASSLSRSMSPFNRMLGKMSTLTTKSGKKRVPSETSSVATSSTRLSDVGRPSPPATTRRSARDAAQTPSPASTPVRPRWNASVTKLEDSPLSPPRVIGRRPSSSALSKSAGSPSSSSRPPARHMSPSASSSFLPPRISTSTPPERPPSASLARPPTPSMIPRPQSRNATSPTASNRMPRSASRDDVAKPSRLPRPSSRNDLDHPHTYPRPSSSMSNFSHSSLASPISPSRPTHRMPKSSSMSLLPGEDPSASLLQLPSHAYGRPHTPPSPFFLGQSAGPRSPSGRPSLPGSSSRGLLSASTSSLGLSPPSSFRQSPVAAVPRSSSRTSLARSGAATPAVVVPTGPYRPHRYNLLDLEIARIVNATANAMSVERVDPLPRGQAAASADLNTALYRFTSPRGDEKVYNCKALELHRGLHASAAQGDGKVVKVMVRIGGGWLDLEFHLAKLFAF